MLKVLFFYFLLSFSAININKGINKGEFHSQTPENFQDSVIHFQEDRPVAIIGDLQRTSLMEIIAGREQNDTERIKMIRNIASENPAALIILGDMVSDGSNESEWIAFEKLLNPVRSKKIPVIPVLGNHEYWGRNSKAIKNAAKYFPQFRENHWYIKKYGGIIFIILDSNRDDLTPEAWSEQRNWFETKLKQFDSDPSVKGIFVCVHHSPYTNSIVTGDNFNVQQAFVPPFLESQKTLALLSGHAHTYERFLKDGKMFVVSGGGGGPRVLLKTGLNIHKDLVDYPGLRPFNYMLLDTKKSGVSMKTEALNKSSSEFFTLDEFSLPFFDFSFETKK